MNRFLRRFSQTGRLEQAKGRGRKAATTPQQDRFLTRLSLRNRFATSTELRRDMMEQSGANISARTIRRRLLNAGLAARCPRKKPLLTKNMTLAKLKWAKDHRDWTVEQWRSVIFSDESKFNMHGSDGKTYVRRRPGESFAQECLKRTVKHPQGQMVWGYISSRGVGRLHMVTGTVNKDVYIGILESKLMHTVTDHFGSARDCVFQDDSAPCHRAKEVRKFLASAGINQLSWPGNSPDLNPIENCWKVMGNKIAAIKPKNKRELQEAIVRVWHHELDLTYIRRLIDSMPDRIAAVIKAKGESTKY